LRTRLDLLLGHFLALRGETRRAAELADLCRLIHPEAEGVSQCVSVVLTILNGKTNKFAKRQYGAAMRHKNPLLCTMGALAQYFFFRWHCSGEEVPSFNRRRDWYTIKVLVGADRREQISWKQQYDDIASVFGALGINADSVTHAPRKAGPQSVELHGVSETQVDCYHFLVQACTVLPESLDYPKHPILGV
jgi:hypothetical protein